MSDRVFVDTNVLVYARDANFPDKQARAEEWLRSLYVSRRGRLSVQVLQEYYTTVTRKLRPGLSRSEARDDVRDLCSWEPLAMTSELLSSAWQVEEDHGLSWWDSLIVAAALHLGCDTLLTEDLAHGHNYGGVVAINPFAEPP